MIIVRSVGERTTEACLERLPKAVLLEGVSPFSRCLHECYERGIASGDHYLFCVDADVLLREGAITAMKDAFRKNPRAGAVVLACDDKLTGRVRIVGVTAYRTCHLEKLLSATGRATTKVRPEAHLRSLLKRGGHRTVFLREDYGRHGYEQYYRDIWRTVIVWTRKRKQDLIPSWRERAAEDPDFAVALKAWTYGLTLKEVHVTNPNDRSKEAFEEALVQLDLEEKAPL